MNPLHFAVIALGAFALLAGALLGGCGGGEPAPATGGDPALFEQEPAHRLDVTMLDVRFDRTTLELPSGALVAIDLTNDGSLEHDFTVDDVQAVHG